MGSGGKARRLRARVLPPIRRRAAQVLCVSLAVLAQAAPGAAREHWRVLGAEFSEPTTRYGHAVLGDDVEYGSLLIRRVETGSTATQTLEIKLPLTHVFEDLEPRLWDVTGDGLPEVVVIETDMSRGAQLAVYDAEGKKRAATPHIGQRNRWLAPIGAADLNGDGHIEIAYIDRPHLAKTLRIWRYEGNKLVEVASAPGLTNHKIGQDFITSGLRDCGAGPELITVSADWSRIITSRLEGGAVISRDLGPFDAEKGLRATLACAAN
ncbi:VCBS repeat-containing protein [Tritonibacter mobilis]|nr:VCBS repeat-containing protein [Tritonibacter mobilis]